MNKGNTHVSGIDKGTSSFMFLSCSTTQENNNEYLCLRDKGWSNYMTSNIDSFSSFDEIIKTQVKLCDDHLVNVLGKGIVIVVTKYN